MDMVHGHGELLILRRRGASEYDLQTVIIIFSVSCVIKVVVRRAFGCIITYGSALKII